MIHQLAGRHSVVKTTFVSDCVSCICWSHDRAAHICSCGSIGWAKTVTDICVHSLPLIGIPLDELYYKRHFVLDGKAHKCHPGLGEDSNMSPEEEKAVKKLIEREKKEKRKGWESPLYT